MSARKRSNLVSPTETPHNCNPVVGGANSTRSAQKAAFRGLLIWITVLLVASSGMAADRQESLQHLQQLREAGGWQQILDATGGKTELEFEHRFLRGLALAHLGRLPEAEVELKQAAEHAGRKSGEILVELAGVQFRQRKLGESSKNLHRAIAMGSTDPYVFNFLATVYYLQGNVEAAIKYWNRVGKPMIQELKVEPEGVLDPLLLDRVLAVSPASKLDVQSLRLTDLRLETLGVFARRRYNLSARQDGQFALTIQTAERADIRTGSPLRSLIVITRELPFRTVNADLRNIRRSAVNWSSTFRWESGNHLFFSRLAAPFGRNPDLLYDADITLRDEEWDLAWGEEARLTELEIVEAKAGITSIAGDRWVWSTGIAASHRRLSSGVPSNFALDPVQAGSEIPWSSGFALASTWETRYNFLHLPERQIKLSGEARWELGRFWNADGALFTSGELSLDGSWQVQKEGRLTATARAQAGSSAGSIPFDRLFRMGMDRDSSLLLRGHDGTRHGRKGNGPMGGGYLLSNLDVQKRLYSNTLLAFSAGPFLDSGKILAARSSSGQEWMWDTGLEGRIGLLGLLQLAVSYGVDTRSGDRLLFWRVVAQ